MMSINNRYIYRSKISEAKFRELVRYFCDDLDATQITSLSGLNRNTVNRYLKAIRERIAEHCESESTVTSQAEGDESLFGPHRVQIKPAGDATTRTTVFGIIKQYSKVYTQIVTNGAKDSPKKSVIAGMANRDRVACADEPPNGEGVEKDAENEFVRNLSRINGIEGFWSIAKMRLVKFRGVNKNTFYLHLKECEFRYNHRNENLYLKILKIVREKPLFQKSPLTMRRTTKSLQSRKFGFHLLDQRVVIEIEQAAVLLSRLTPRFCPALRRIVAPDFRTGV